MTNLNFDQEWQDYVTLRNGAEHSVVGTLKVYPQLHSPQLDNQRDILVYLPPAYTQGDKRYPVIYMHDGQNLFDRVTSYAGEWQVDETMETLSQEGLEAIIVGIPNMGVERMAEYSPFPDARHGGGRGEAYLAFLVETVKPLIDRDFRTLTGRLHTGIIGSSMGGLISLYAFFRYADHFALAGVMSPSVWFARPALSDFLHSTPRRGVRGSSFAPGKLYLDVGAQEFSHHFSDLLLLRLRSRRYTAVVRSLRQLLQELGYQDERMLLYVEERGAGHNEAAWGSRLPNALRFLLRP